VREDRPDAGLIASLQRMLATLLTLAHTRLELVAVEIEEQLRRAASVLLWSVLAIFFGSLTVLLLAITIVIAFWEEHRLLAAGLVTGTFALMAVVAVICILRQLRARPKLLSASVAELARDAAALDRDAA
jgi:uncharacterized membrane protein YqjE